MNKALRILLALIAAPFVPWAVYWVAFAGMNLPYILAGEDAVYLVSSSVVWDVSSFSVMTTLAAVLYWSVFKPKQLS